MACWSLRGGERGGARGEEGVRADDGKVTGCRETGRRDEDKIRSGLGSSLDDHRRQCEECKWVQGVKAQPSLTTMACSALVGKHGQTEARNLSEGRSVILLG